MRSSAAVRMLLVLCLPACREGSTAQLPAQLETRMAGEGVVRRAADLTFRYTEAPGRRTARWEDRRASIVVTPATILIHKNAKVGLEINGRTRRDVAVEREGTRVRLRAGRESLRCYGPSCPPTAMPKAGPGTSGP